MAKVDFPRLKKVVSKGRVYYYAWAGGPRIEATYGTKEFADEYYQCINPTASWDRQRVSTWVALYKASPEWAGTGDDTKRLWHPKLDEISEYFGQLSPAAFDKPAIRGEIKAWRDKWRKEGKDRMADVAKQVLSRVCSFMVEEGALKTNPCTGIANVYKGGNRAEIIWTDDDLAQLAAGKGVSKEIVWAARLGALTGLRQSAALELPWSRVHIDKKHIDMRGTKVGGKGRGIIPIYPELRALLDEIPKRATTVLTTTDGSPWGSGFGASWTKAMKRSGLDKKGLHYHDTRGTAVTKFYVAGFNSDDIAETLGWSLPAVEKLLNVYCKRDERMLSRVQKLERIGTPTEQ